MSKEIIMFLKDRYIGNDMGNRSWHSLSELDRFMENTYHTKERVISEITPSNERDFVVDYLNQHIAKLQDIKSELVNVFRSINVELFDKLEKGQLEQEQVTEVTQQEQVGSTVVDNNHHSCKETSNGLSINIDIKDIDTLKCFLNMVKNN